MSENTHESVTVMGLQGLVSTGLSGNVHNPPKFVTNVTSKVRYRDALRRWIKMMKRFAKVDTKAKAILEGAGHVIYMSCDESAQDLLKKAERSGLLSLDGDSNEMETERMIESILDVIAKDSPTESIKREVDLLTAVQTCVRKSGETVEAYAIRFHGAVAKYTNHTTLINDATSRQFAILMLRNAYLTPDTMNALIFHLTSKASTSVIKISTQLSFCEEDLRRLEKVLRREDDEAEDHDKKLLAKIGEGFKKIQDQRACNVPMFSVDDARNSLSHVDDTQIQVPNSQTNLAHTGGHRTQGSLLGKRTTGMQPGRGQFIKKLKEESTCRACGQLGHWYRDREECRQKMKNKKGAKHNEGKISPVPDVEPPQHDEAKAEKVIKSLFQ